jgi:hypothetical protein
MSGTALPASAVITSSDQVAAVVIDGHHVRQHSLTKDDVEDVYLRVRVDAAGNVIGEGNDGTAVVRSHRPDRFAAVPFTLPTLFVRLSLEAEVDGDSVHTLGACHANRLPRP